MEVEAIMTAWHIHINTTVPPGPMTDDQADALITALPGYPTTHHDADAGTLEAAMQLVAPDALTAVNDAAAVLTRVTTEVFGQPATVVRIDAQSVEHYLKTAGQTQELDLFTAADAARLLGVTRQAAHDLASRGAFGQPLATSDTAGKLYDGTAVRHYAANRPPRRGPRRNPTQ